MQIKQNLVDKGKYNIKCPYSMKPEYITFHNTDNSASAKNEIINMIKEENNKEVSFHIAVDDIEAIQGIPLNRNAWHAGDGKNGTGNRKSIGVEICYNKLGANNDKFKKAEANAVIICAQLLKQFGLGIDRLKPHKYWSGKNCPSTTNHQDFINKVKVELDKLNNREDKFDMEKIVTYFGDADIFAATIVSQKHQCPLMKKSDFDKDNIKVKEIIQIGGNKADTDRFTSMKNACKYL